MDKWIVGFDRIVKTLVGPVLVSRPLPEVKEGGLSEKEQQQSAALMRVNHSGEVSAQALYLGQSLTARRPDMKKMFDLAAAEEADHLGWCETRIKELNGQTSKLNLLWFVGSFTIGACAGLFGDRISMGFLAETERQVGEHLAGHLEKLPVDDARTRMIVSMMQSDEAKHEQSAKDAGGAQLPAPVRRVMRLCSYIMTRSAYRL
ncbi:MAG: 2-polyprenyl-3-methyl-6-methoxy-1,4-benzoquinone monooxygenase [Proteobacteria bacterium]|nr:2-polyprenyl-3-methyl-6-methoxy-1,4-benzoquinone monooxygenase [Pseudomonadota bacterium]MDE3208054.1 2-polyprenyl-3-methyl-6-methoxy-1,4-benzoquinone monooxygenase [Pseudomonadota bacterium]